MKVLGVIFGGIDLFRVRPYIFANHHLSALPIQRRTRHWLSTWESEVSKAKECKDHFIHWNWNVVSLKKWNPERFPWRHPHNKNEHFGNLRNIGNRQTKDSNRDNIEPCSFLDKSVKTGMFLRTKVPMSSRTPRTVCHNKPIQTWSILNDSSLTLSDVSKWPKCVFFHVSIRLEAT